jgi:hypothetical protein
LLGHDGSTIIAKIKRLAASFVVACRDRGLSDGTAKDSALTCVRAYRESMAEFGQMETLELWYNSLGPEELLAECSPSFRKRIIKRIEQEKSKGRAEELFPKLVERKEEMPIIKDQLPTIFHNKENPPGKINKILHDAIAGYRATLPTAYQSLLDRFELRDAAMKVVGIGSVGTSCWVFLFMAAGVDPLFLQIKEARASVLEPYAGKSEFPNSGQRVVNGYRIFSGMVSPKRDFFVRQLRDTKD